MRKLSRQKLKLIEQFNELRKQKHQPGETDAVFGEYSKMDVAPASHPRVENGGRIVAERGNYDGYQVSKV